MLGVTAGPPDIDHIKLRNNFSSVGSLARKNASAGSLYGLNSRNNSAAGMADQGSKKKVGFAPQPHPSSHRSSEAGAVKQAVHLTSSDGLIVVSAFLPVHLTRSSDGEWSADWDYEALLSMQTHLRVTRVGTVKWRGWHGNVGGGKSDHTTEQRRYYPPIHHLQTHPHDCHNHLLLGYVTPTFRKVHSE